jgi:hypothetical protein
MHALVPAGLLDLLRSGINSAGVVAEIASLSLGNGEAMSTQSVLSTLMFPLASGLCAVRATQQRVFD